MLQGSGKEEMNPSEQQSYRKAGISKILDDVLETHWSPRSLAHRVGVLRLFFKTEASTAKCTFLLQFTI